MIWFLLLGLTALILGAELLVRGASKLAMALGISPLVVGLTVVAFGTSSPELAVSVQSAWGGQVDIALGNVVGSNIFNVLFILGLSALITPLVVDRQLIRQEVPLMIGASLLLWALAANQSIGRIEGVLLVGLLATYTIYVIRASRRQTAADRQESAAPPVAEEKSWDSHWSIQVAMVLVGLTLLVLGSNWLVEAAVAFARALGVSELVIGLTLIAAGTSLPEVATSIMAALRGERDIAVGNVVGSNIFNILGVLGVSAAIAPTSLTVAPSLLVFDLPVMVAVALACLPIFFTGHLIARWEGGLFFAYYLIYTIYLILMARQHDGLAQFGWIMVSFVLPLTFATLAILAGRHWRQSHG
jgi:cation:H+ antiporter